MGKTKVTDFLVYRFRYILGYIALGVILASLLFLAGFITPNGISPNEQTAVVASEALSMTEVFDTRPEQIINAPYHLLQKASINLLGMNTVSIKLPSLILGGLAIVALHGLLRLWFRRNVALITSIIAASSGLFLFLTQQGTPEIGYFFWNTALLLAASRLTQSQKFGSFWLVIAAGLAALSLYSPLGIYIVAGLAITCVIHPHARFVMFKRPAWALVAAGALFLLFITPLVISIIRDPSVINILLGITGSAIIQGFDHLNELPRQYLGFWVPSAESPIYPAYGAGILLTALLGLYRLLTAKYTAKSYILSIWLVLTILAILLVPNVVGFTLLPIVLLLAFAIDYLIRSWYQLFPLNPYARIAGLVPLAILMLGLSIPSIQQFAYGYHYSDVASQVFTKDLALLGNRSDALLVVPQSQKAFYSAYARQAQSNLIVLDDLAPVRTLQSSKKAPETVILFRDFTTATQATPSAILTSQSRKDADRFYLYTNTAI